MQYLLLLQRLREASPTWFNEMILFLSEVMGGTYGLILMAIIYWCFHKRTGRLAMLSFATSYELNQTLKNIFCVSRPFVLNPELTPYKNASGYSFPSGHTMLGTSVYTSIAEWFKKHLGIVLLCGFLSFMTAFGRNWIGVHTLQDVVVGMICAMLVVYINGRLLDYFEKDNKTKLYLIISTLWAIAVLFFFKGSEKVVGLYLGTVCGFYIEHNYIQFELPTSTLKKILRLILGILILFLLNKVLLPMIVLPNEGLTIFISNFLTFFYVMAIYPFIFKMIKL